MGRIITSPMPLEHPFQQSIFLAGGISNCPNWQLEVAERIAGETQAVVYNPRRENFDMSAVEEISKLQIAWEFKALRLCAFNLFWFPSETICPITLLEYGSAMERVVSGRLICGTHPDYQRRFDLIEQAKLTDHLPPLDSLDGLVDLTIKILNAR